MLHVPAVMAETRPLQRAQGTVRLAVADRSGSTHLCALHQSGSARCLMPRRHGARPLEAVLLNTSGGITGGDRFDYALDCAAGTRLVATTQAAERIYRAHEGTGIARTCINVDADAFCAWLPQETILFNGGRFERHLDVALAQDARALLLETVVFGRLAMGETLSSAHLRDRWRIRRAGRLVYADTLRLDGDINRLMAQPATGMGAGAASTLVLCDANADDHVDATRARLSGHKGIEAGVSAFDGLLILRLMAQEPHRLRSALAAVLPALSGHPLPRVWSL